jgi:hypothetical protein
MAKHRTHGLEFMFVNHKKIKRLISEHGQGADLVETRDWDDLPSGVIESSYSLVEFLSDGGDLAQLELGDPRLELRPQVGEDLGREFAHPVRQAALAR